MKNFLYYSALALTFFSSSLAAPHIEASSIIIDLQEITQLTHQAIIARSPMLKEEVALRGASNTIALILSGLAQTCAQVSQVIPQNPIQQVVLGTVATSLTTAAAVILDKKQQREQKKNNHAALAKALTDLSIQLEKTTGDDKTKMPENQLFTTLKAIQNPVNKEAFIQIILNEQSLADDFLYDFIDLAEEAFAANQEALVDAVKITAGMVLLDWLEKQSCTDQTTPLSKASGVIVYAPSEDGHELPELVDQVATIVANKLLSAYVVMHCSIS